MIKKELIIKEDLSKFKEVIFFFNYKYPFYTQNIQNRVMIFKINEKEREYEIKPVQTISCWKLCFNPNDLNQGENIIIIKPKAILDSPLYIKIDTLYSFGRSYFNKESKWERLKKGEYMVWVVLKKEGSVESFITQGIDYYEKGMYEKAVIEFHKALEKNPNSPYIHFNLGLVYEKTREFDMAIEEYKNELKVADNLNLIEIHNSLVRVYYFKGMWNEILEESKKIVEIDPKHVVAHKNIGSIYYKKRMFNEAYNKFQKVLNLDPNDIFAKQMLEECKKFLDKEETK